MGKSLNNKRKLGEYAENLGGRASPPTARLDGSALQTGDTYYDTSTGARVYNGTDWATLGGGAGGSVAWVDVTGKPSTFAPSAHTHVIADTTGLQAALDAKQATLISATNIKTVNGTSLLGSGDLVISGGGTGTVMSVAVTTFNGFAGSVANATTTPSITLSTTLTGLLKGNGTAMEVAAAGTDYQAPIGTISGLAKGNGANALTAAVAGTDYQSPLVSGTNIKTINGSSVLGSGDLTVGGSGSLTLIASQTISSGSANVDFTGLSGYTKYLIVMEMVKVASGASAYCYLGTGSTTWISSGYYARTTRNDGSSVTAYQQSNSSTLVLPGASSGSDGLTGVNVQFTLVTSGNNAMLLGVGHGWGSTTQTIDVFGGGGALGAPLTGIRFTAPSSTFASGKISVYGISS